MRTSDHPNRTTNGQEMQNLKETAPAIFDTQAADDKLSEYYSSNFTFHGLSFILHAKSKTERVIWLLLVVLAIGYVSYALVQEVHEHMKYEVRVVKKKVRVDQLPFPAVTFCYNDVVRKPCLNCTCEWTEDEKCSNFTEGYKTPIFDSGNSINIKLRRVDVQRLPPPYTSECGRGTSFFPGQYTVAGCQSTCEIQSMMEKCNGRLLQKWRRKLPTLLRNKLNTSAGYEDCVTSENYRASLCSCPDPCRETEFQFDTTMSGNDEAWKDHLGVNIRFEDLRVVIEREVPAVPWNHVLANFGGLLGLFVGASLMSGMEIIFYLWMKLCAKCRKSQI